MPRGWVIFDRSRQYIPVVYATEREATAELLELLAPYPTENEWWRRLHVDRVGGHPLVRTGEPAYGYRRMSSRHGLRLEPLPREQRIIRLVRQLQAAGDNFVVIADRLNDKNLRPRHDRRFEPEHIDEMLHDLGRNDGERKETEGVAELAARATRT